MFYDFQNKLYKLIGISDYTNKFVPVSTNLHWHTYQDIANNNEIISKIIQGRQNIVGMAGWDIEVSMSKSEKSNQRISKSTYEFLENLGVDKLRRDFVYMMTVYNNCFILLNDDNRPVIHPPHRFNVYWDNINQKHYQIKMIVNGAEQEQNYEHGKDILHIMGDRDSFNGIATPDIDTVYGWILLYNSAIKANKTFIESGNVGALVAIFEKEMEQILSKPDANGNTHGENWLKAFVDKISGYNRKTNSYETHKIGFLAGLKEFKDISKNNNDMQLHQLLDRAEKAIYNGFGETQVDDNSTYSNSQTFKYEKHQTIGRQFETQFELIINKFILKKYNIETNENLYFKFNPPSNPDELKAHEFSLKSLQALSNLSDNHEFRLKIINDYYDSIGQAQIEAGIIETITPDVIPIEAQANQTLETNSTFAEKKKIKKFIAIDEIKKQWEKVEPDNNLKKTKKGIKPSLIKALIKQNEKWAEKALKYDNVDEILNNIDDDYPKLETFYSINTLKKDMLKFADIGINEANSTIKAIDKMKGKKKTKFAQDMEYNQAILDLVDYQATTILKVTKNEAGDMIDVDNTTRNIIKSMLINYTLDELSELSIAEMLKEIKTQFFQKAEIRAEVILIPPLGGIVEESRFITYKEKNYKYKKTETVNDDRVIQISKNAEAKGIVPIDFEYSTAWGYKKAFLPLHANDRDTMTFGQEIEDFTIYG
jgi:hypothetical protein